MDIKLYNVLVEKTPFSERLKDLLQHYVMGITDIRLDLHLDMCTNVKLHAS